MNKIIPSISVIVLCGCSTQQIRNPDVSIHIDKANPSPHLTSQSGNNPPATTSGPDVSANRHRIADRPLRQHSIISVSRPEQPEEPNKQESLIPRITRYIKQGIASWYGPRFHGRKTANGEIFDMYAMTAAHKTLPIPSYAQVTNLENNRSIIVRINDRGPYVGNRLLDLSYAAAKELGIYKEGTGKVEIVALTEDQAAPQRRNDANADDRDFFDRAEDTSGDSETGQRIHDTIAVRHEAEPENYSYAYKGPAF